MYEQKKYLAELCNTGYIVICWFTSYEHFRNIACFVKIQLSAPRQLSFSTPQDLAEVLVFIPGEENKFETGRGQ